MPAQRISKDKRALVLAALAEGTGINSTCRMFHVGKPSLLRFIRETGKACEDWHNRNFRNLAIERMELDEQWAYVHTHKERMSRIDKANFPGRGDCWLWAALDSNSKAIVSWTTGKRTSVAADRFCDDLSVRLTGRVQITSDPLNSYAYAIRGAFGDRADYAQETKVFQSSKVPGHDWPKFRVDPLVGVERKAIFGNPNLQTATAAHVERYFLTVRQSNKRCARKTLAYSKKWDNHALTASVHIFIYNMVRRHESLKTTPAVALGIADKRWTLEDVVEMTDKYLEAQDNAAFEAAFESKFAQRPTARTTYAPCTPKTPWYLDPESGGPNPLVKKPGIQYDESAELGDDGSL